MNRSPKEWMMVHLIVLQSTRQKFGKHFVQQLPGVLTAVAELLAESAGRPTAIPRLVVLPG
jgi:hypothetical protein